MGRKCGKRRRRKGLVVNVNVNNQLCQNQHTEAQAAAQALALLKMLYQFNIGSPGATNRFRESESQIFNKEDR